MDSIELILELPADENSDDGFPGKDALPHSGYEGHASGLNGEQFLQLGVIVTAASVEVLKVWQKELLAKQVDISGRLEANSLLFFDATSHPLGNPALAVAGNS